MLPAQDLQPPTTPGAGMAFAKRVTMAPERILVVDGDIAAGKALRAILCERGFDAVSAAGAEDALSLVPSFGPGALLVDAALPETPDLAPGWRRSGRTRSWW